MASESLRMLMPGLALVLSLAFNPVPARAQGQSPGVPDAPLPAAPSAPTPAKPSFALPKPSYVPPGQDIPVPAKSTAAEFCHAPAVGEFAGFNQPVLVNLRGALDSYFQDVNNRIHGQWVHNMSIGQRNAWATAKIATVRYGVRPDGSLIGPELTVSSGHANDDEHALEAVRSLHSFPPLPAGIDHPVFVCLRLGYNTGEPQPELPNSMFKDTQKKP
ncbi:TonB family C-terminal domain-containing protein [Bryocella elongata]|uniref:TonB family C-terminal domain-containing protein n=1 Tax=Bryocella elongata TaxID=863522 RepID=A0A1H6BMW0_9BACT|nr:energy transducer TonB [Bryocella elongata]SEG62010.1 TonB family C-terminal domain-containing protein [Bryocella elongata]